jgi:hypothetical protein
MKKLLTLTLVLCSVVGSAQMRGGARYDPGAVRSNLTNIASGSALGVANGGTGKTTAAEALAALGGASLNGSSTVAFNASIYNAATGTAAAPAYSFSSDPDTGIFSAYANGIGVVGDLQLRHDATAFATLNITASSTNIIGAFNTTPILFRTFDGVSSWNNHLYLNYATGNTLVATTTDDGANKLQVNGTAKAGAISTPPSSPAADDATPSVLGKSFLFINNNTAPLTITQFDDGYVGQHLTVLISGAVAAVTIQQNDNFFLSTNLDFVHEPGYWAYISFILSANGWVETGRAQRLY